MFLDQSHVSHEISEFALDAAIGHVVDGDGVTIVDELGPPYGAFQSTGAWRDGTDEASFAGHYQYSSIAGTTATWTFTGAPGEYRVSATWGADATSGTAVPYALAADRLSNTTVDQTAPPVGWTEGATPWQDLAAAALTSSGVLTVSLTVPPATTVHADAVRFERLCTACNWYADADGDGFGDATVTRLACTGEDGWVASATDCDDSRSTVHPDAVDVPDDGVDQDCDGSDAAGTDDSGDSGGAGDGDSPDPRNSPPAAKGESAGCGCASTSDRPSVGAFFGVLAWAALRGRRRAKARGP